MIHLKDFLSHYFKSDVSVEEILKKTGLFETYDIASLVPKLKTLSFSAGSLIVKENEIGEHLYIIKEGAIRIFTLHQGKEIVLARLEKYRYFGEQALLYEHPAKRNASAMALEDSILYQLSQKDFLEVLHQNTALKNVLEEYGKKQLLEKAEKQLELLGFLGKNPLTKIKRIVTYSDQEKIFSAGDPAKTVYFVLSGQVDIHFSETSQKEYRTQVTKGQIFGEKGVLEKSVRKGTAIASGQVNLIEFDGAHFQKIYQNTPALKEYIVHIQKIYQLSKDQYVTLYQGKFMDLDAICATFHFTSGETVLSMKVVGKDIFSISWPSISIQEKISYQSEEVTAEIFLYKNKLIGFTYIGFLDVLPELCQMVLNQEPLSIDQKKLFKHLGRFTATQAPTIEENAPVCYCMNVPYKTVIEAIQSGKKTLGEIIDDTGAGSVCGGCHTKINGLLGHTDWQLVYIKKVIPYSDTIHAFQLQTAHKKVLPSHPGQHIIIQAYIDNHWVERPYTLTAVNTHRDYDEIIVQKEPHGVLSGWLFQQEEKDPLLRMSPPQGNFILSPEEANDFICFVGGIGVTPALAFARFVSTYPHPIHLHIDYSAHTKTHFICQEELEAIKCQTDHLSVFFRETSEMGHLTPVEIKKIIQDHHKPAYFICGPKPFEQMVLSTLREAHVEEDRIHVETFISIGAPLNASPI